MELQNLQIVKKMLEKSSQLLLPEQPWEAKSLDVFDQIFKRLNFRQNTLSHVLIRSLCLSMLAFNKKFGQF